MKLTAYQKGADRMMARVQGNEALPLRPWSPSGLTQSRVFWPLRRPYPGESRWPTWFKFRRWPTPHAGLRWSELCRPCVQDGNTSNLIFSGAKLAAYASGAMTLKPGDLIATGTPDGIGATRKPPMFLHSGDTVAVEIERIGRITNTIVQRLPC